MSRPRQVGLNVMVFNALKILLALWALLTAESAFPSHWWRPDMVLLLLVPFALRFGRSGGAAVGFLGGMLLGMISGAVFGILAIVYGVAGYLLGWWGEREAPSWFVMLIGTVFAASAVDIALTAVARMSPVTISPSVAVLNDWFLPTLIVNAVLVIPADRLVRILLGKAYLVRMSWRI